MDRTKAQTIFLRPDQGRAYAMGRIGAVFKADRAETANKFSVSEWWLEPKTKGPGAHSHDDEDSIFYIIEGTMTMLIDDQWLDAPKGSFILSPAGGTHDFENRSDKRAGLLSITLPGGFEDEMPGIAQWFAEHSPGTTD